MTTTRGIDLILMWHMHQPDYRVDAAAGSEFAMPWTYLHAIKDYSDMVAHLERHPGVRAVVNFVPVLLEQIEDYTDQFASGSLRDPLLRFLARDSLEGLALDERQQLLDCCFRGNHETMLAPYPHYKRLHELYQGLASDDSGVLSYLSGDYFSDLVTWYHLAWCGETERRRQPLLARLLAKGSNFDRDDRSRLLELLGEIIGGLIPRYRALASAGRIELSTTPYAHPLSPLLLDLACARQAQPDAPLPYAARYPGGRTRVRAHVEQALHSHAMRFGHTATGMWPAEGAVSDALVELLADGDCAWIASSEAVLANSLRLEGTQADGARHDWLYQPYRVAGRHKPLLFFRDERLSDLIGFEYAKWHGSDAASHFVGELERIGAEAPQGTRPVVSVILDGENAWEYYPYNGFYFLDHLYELLEASASIRMTTFADTARDASRPCGELQSLVAGSWVYGTLSTWIGEADKNRAWDLLCAAKDCFDRALTSGRLSEAQRSAAERQLARCESSDWFWWFGSYNPQQAVQTFDRLYRRNLSRLYELIGLASPAALENPVSHGAGKPEHGGAMRRAS